MSRDTKHDRWQAAEYEAEYHQAAHGHLITSSLYYDLRAREALEDLYEGIDVTGEVFEFGVGLGKNIVLLDERAGYDISEFARSFCADKGIPTYSDMSEVTDDRYPVAVCSHVLEHVEDPLATLKAIRSKVKRGGVLILALPAERHGKVPFEVDHNQHLFAWNFRTINNLLARAGFTIRHNRFRYRTAQYKLRHLGRAHYPVYSLVTRMLGRLFGRRDMIVIAERR